MAAWTPNTTWTVTSSGRVEARSMSTPAKSVKIVTGNAWAKVTRPSAAGEPVRSSTSQAWVVRSSQLPHWESAALAT